jgi:cytochrome c-type protein NapB
MAPPTYTQEGVGRARAMTLAAVAALAVIGYVVGLRAGVPEGRPGISEIATALPEAAPDSQVIPALTYTEIGAGALRAAGPGETWAAMSAALQAPVRKPNTDPEARAHSLDTRAERRAFNGAPPAIPHAAVRMDDRSCLVCHGQALEIGDRVARSLPHAALTNCTQCHAAAAPAFLATEGGVLADSSWQGIAAPRAGERALPGAPPAVPHTLQMRANCLACHGAQGWVGMQTSHPERRSCLQCHAPTEDRDHPGRLLEGAALLPPLKLVSR